MMICNKIIKIIDMGLSREPLEADFFFDPKPLSKKEQQMISDFIKADKRKRKHKKISKKRTYAQQNI